MRNSWIGIVVAAAMLAGCGGGGGSEAQQQGQLTAAKTYVAAKPTVGDYYLWENVSREQGSTVDYYNFSTKLVRGVAADGAISAVYLNDSIPTTNPETYASNTVAVEFDSLGRWTSARTPSCTRTTNQPIYAIAPRTVSVGMNWQYAGLTQTTRCEHELAVQVTADIKDSVLAMDSVVVEAGAFNALKVTRSETSEDGNFRTDTERTCWWEPDLGIDVKCVANVTVTNKATGEKRSRVETESLVGFSNQRLARKFDSTGRFMGNWKGRYDGMAQGQGASGSCTLAIDWVGKITGSCTGPAVFNISGQIRADGTLAFAPTSNGNSSVMFTGQLDSLQQMSGSWGVPNYGGGTWVMTQD